MHDRTPIFRSLNMIEERIREKLTVEALARGVHFSKYHYQRMFREAVGDKKGIRRYGSCILPMDEALVLCAVDLSGRPYYVSDAQFTAERIGDLDTEMVKEFFYAVSYSGQMNLHFKVLSGSNNHHICEAMFKAFAKALDAAVSYDERITDVLSTKGSL